MSNPVSIQLTVHADSNADFDELLKLALHNLAKLQAESWHEPVGAVMKANMEGGLGGMPR